MAAKADQVLLDAGEQARAAAEAIAERGSVGEHVAFDLVEDRVGTHYFACLSPAYPGWRWAVTVARVPRGKTATISETNLLPAEGALLSPAWVPYADRLAPGDLAAGDVLPYAADDPMLVQGFEATGDDDVDQVAHFELGLGRVRVLGALGRAEAAQRWYDGPSGPTSDIAVRAKAPCATCGYFVPMAGALRATFGVCANEWSPSDGRVVSLNHGCGAHSEVDIDKPAPMPVAPVLLDDFAVDATP